MPGLPQAAGPCLLLLLAAACAAGAQDLTADVPAALKVGFAAWGGGPLQPEHEYLRFSLALELRDRLGDVRERELSPREREALAALLARKRMDALSTQLRETNRSRDEILFKGLAETERASSLAPLEAKREQLLESIARMERELPHIEVLPRALALAYEPADLMEAPRYSPVEAARKSGVDLVVWGRLEPVQGYLYWRVACTSVLLEEELFAVEQVSAPEDIAEAAAAAVDGLAEALLGRPWASLIVSPEQQGARVRVDGRARGIGPVELPFLQPGPHDVEVSLEGFGTHEETVILEPRAHRELDVSLLPLETVVVGLDSTPAGALVYRDSLYVGATPLDLTLPPAGVVTYRLVSEGYFDRYETVSAAGPSRVAASLRRRIVDPTEWQEVRRKRFFRSLGALALSVPIPIVSYALALDSATARTNTVRGSEEYDRFTRRATISYALYLGGIFVSAVLGLNMALDLGEYVRYAEDPAF